MNIVHICLVSLITLAISACSEPVSQTGNLSEGNEISGGSEFLQRNASRPGVLTTSTGLQYEVLVQGEGKSPSSSSTVVTHYTGTFIDGRVFDSSVERGVPATFPVNGVIRGWTEALQMMKEGARWRLFIPPELGYGARGAGDRIPPDTVLIFEIELLEVK
ncbi:MAG: hypothetical protein CMQ40_01455 [Gammaproteobacteria bacterium]|nr:hypothetical protein [Gammaproteobacteria bacterium]